MHIKSNHPLQELLAKLLHGIEGVSAKEQKRMVNRACREVVKWHKEQIEQMRLWIRDMETRVYICPECEMALMNFNGHDDDCELAAMLVVRNE